MSQKLSSGKRSGTEKQLFIIGLILSLFIFLAACVEKTQEAAPTLAASPTPKVIYTAYAALTEGVLVNLDGCVRIRSEQTGSDDAIVWPPDVSAAIEGDKIRIITGIVTGKREESVVKFGERVRLGGGETSYPDEQLLQNLPANCPGPYWVIASVLPIVQSTPTP
ncbi:MAG TPA: hypothetical protein PKW33_15810 [Anaerolineaceae bacterium]|nr:hypothetical protein [Anaerolineaceae bacterium]HPN53062.1 hypothetical protein [Anaerolineaceae bacterium]